MMTLWTLGAMTLALSAGCQRAAPSPMPDAPPADVDVVREHWPNGRLKVEQQVLRRSDGTVVPHGRYTAWYDNGQMEYEATYVEGQIDGIETAWHRNGQKRTEQHYRRGLRHGPRYAWDEHGRLRQEENYADDLPHGTWTIWRDNGEVKWQAEFDHGVPKGR